MRAYLYIVFSTIMVAAARSQARRRQSPPNVGVDLKLSNQNQHFPVRAAVRKGFAFRTPIPLRTCRSVCRHFTRYFQRDFPHTHLLAWKPERLASPKSCANYNRVGACR
jgi:hypothetical protein